MPCILVVRLSLSQRLGNFAEANAARRKAIDFQARLPDSAAVTRGVLTMAAVEMRLAQGDDWAATVRRTLPILESRTDDRAYALTTTRAIVARAYARLGDRDGAMRWLDMLPDVFQRAPGWSPGYILAICLASDALWSLHVSDHLDQLQDNLEEKVVKPDFRSPMVDSRLSMAHLAAIRGQDDEAMDWFAKARIVLEEQGARPLRAIVDYDEALMHQRRGGSADADPAKPLINSALARFRQKE